VVAASSDSLSLVTRIDTRTWIGSERRLGKDEYVERVNKPIGRDGGRDAKHDEIDASGYACRDL